MSDPRSGSAGDNAYAAQKPGSPPVTQSKAEEQDLSAFINSIVQKDGINAANFESYLKSNKETGRKVRHSFAIFENMDGIDATVYSSLGEKESEVMSLPQTVNYTRVGSVAEVGLLKANSPAAAVKPSDEKQKTANKKLLKLIHEIVAHPDNVVIKRKGDVMIAVVDKGLQTKAYNLNEILNRVDWNQIAVPDNDLEKAVKYILNRTKLFAPSTVLALTPDHFDPKNESSWSDYFRSCIENHSQSHGVKDLKIYHAHLAHQLAINVQSTGLFIATNSLLRGRISQTIDNRDSIEGYKKYNENEVLHTLLVAVLTIDAIVRFKERYDYTARVEFNATKQGEFTERGILSLANGPSDYMQKEFMREIEKSKTSGAQTSSKTELNKAMALLFQLSKDPSFSVDHKAYLELKQRLSDTPGLQLTPSEKDLMARMEKNVKQLDMCIEKMNGDDLKILNNEKIHDPRFPSDPSAQISAGLLIRHLKSLESLSVDMPSYWENVPSRPSSTAEEPRRPFPAVKMGARKQKRIAAMNEVSSALGVIKMIQEEINPLINGLSSGSDSIAGHIRAMAANDNAQFALQDFNHRMMEVIGSLRQSSQKIESGLVNGGDIKQMRALCLECMKSKIYLDDEHADLMILIAEIKKQAQENPNSIAYLKLLEESLANIKKLSEMFGSTYKMVNNALLVMTTQNENVARTEIQKTAGQTRGAAPAAIHDLSTASGSYTAGGHNPMDVLKHLSASIESHIAGFTRLSAELKTNGNVYDRAVDKLKQALLEIEELKKNPHLPSEHQKSPQDVNRILAEIRKACADVLQEVEVFQRQAHKQDQQVKTEETRETPPHKNK